VVSEPIQALLDVLDVLDRLGVRYAVGGSIASSVFGEPRSTEDADLIADLRSEHVRPFVEALRVEFYVDEESVREALRRHSSFNLIHFKLVRKVDVFIPGNRPLDRAQLERRRLMILVSDPQRSAYVTSPEDIVLLKLDWFRQGGGVSDRQWRDVLGVLKERGAELDIPYTQSMAAPLGISDLLARALRESGRVPE